MSHVVLAEQFPEPPPPEYEPRVDVGVQASEVPGPYPYDDHLVQVTTIESTTDKAGNYTETMLSGKFSAGDALVISEVIRQAALKALAADDQRVFGEAPDA